MPIYELMRIIRMNTNDTNKKEMYTKKQNKNIRIISINLPRT